MDTKLKKTHKLTWLIIMLAVLIPAIALVACYPWMESAVTERIAYYENLVEEKTGQAGNMENTEKTDPSDDSEYWYEISSNFVNYAVESSYYLYGMKLQETTKEEVHYDAIFEYRWSNDYYTTVENTLYYLEYAPATEEDSGMTKVYADSNVSNYAFAGILQDEQTAAWDQAYEYLFTQDALAYLTLEWDEYGNLIDISSKAISEEIYFDRTDLYSKAQKTIDQYRGNATFLNRNAMDTGQEAEIPVEQLEPKSFKIVFVVTQDSYFAGDYGNEYNNYPVYYYYNLSSETLYWETGAFILVIVATILVAFFAMILPFFKKLETGWEKIFCLPFEVILCITGLGIAVAVGMYYAMSYTSMMNIKEFIEAEGSVLLLGYQLSPEFIYRSLLVLNCLGWAIGFFMEYICVASFRQFLCGPSYYIKHRLLSIKIIRWCFKKIKQLYHYIKGKAKQLYEYVTDLDISEKLNESIIKIVLANLVIVTLLCCLWFAGIVGVLIYSVVLYVLLRKYGETIQKQYQSILHATGEMAEGNLKVKIEEDLGLFAPLGNELQKVQDGFSKAVVEEAKSQNMKTELITNVSHDLKTPLTAIITYVDLLKKEDLTEEERASYLATLEQKSQRLKILIEDLFEISKANSGKVKMNFMDVDVVSLMKQVRSEMEALITSSTLDFRWNLPEEKVVLSLDGDRMYRVFENLLNNAVKYAMPQSRVYVDITRADATVKMIFRNMSATVLNFDPERLTERFVRGDQSRNSEGSGLGLAIAKSFVELQNGQFQIEVDGDLFKVTLAFSDNTH